jgi:hypothetical protein
MQSLRPSLHRLCPGLALAKADASLRHCLKYSTSAAALFSTGTYRAWTQRERDREEIERAARQQKALYENGSGLSGWTIGGASGTNSRADGWSLRPEDASAFAERKPAPSEGSAQNSSWRSKGAIVALPSVSQPAELLNAMESHPADALELLLNRGSAASDHLAVSRSLTSWSSHFTRMNGTGVASFLGTVVYGLCNLLDPLLLSQESADAMPSPTTVYRDLTLATLVLSVALEPSRLRSLQFDAEDQALLYHSHVALKSIGGAIDGLSAASSELSRAASFTLPSTGATVPLSSLRLPLDIADACLRQHNQSVLSLQPLYDRMSLTMRRQGLKYTYRSPSIESKCGYLNWLLLPVSHRFLDEPQNEKRKAEVLGHGGAGSLNRHFLSSSPLMSPIRHATLEVAGEWNMLPTAYLDPKRWEDEHSDKGDNDFAALSLSQRLKSRNLAVLDRTATVLITNAEREEYLAPSIAQSIDINRGKDDDADSSTSSGRAPASRSECRSLPELLNFISLTLAGPAAFSKEGKHGQSITGMLR